MLKKYFIAAGVIVLAGILFMAYLLVFAPGPDLSKYDFLKEPRITTLPGQKMLVVVAFGDPNTVGGKAFGLLFKTYFRIPDVPRSNLTARARWAGDMNSKNSWKGYYALPVPDKTASLPEMAPEPGYKIELVTWEYGTVAEILHVGPYAEEAPTIGKLHQFIKQQGYEIIGIHEEEYLRGPGMFSRGNPAKYYTIIRLRVKKI